VGSSEGRDRRFLTTPNKTKLKENSDG
jgi:hypothetical protein